MCKEEDTKKSEDYPPISSLVCDYKLPPTISASYCASSTILLVTKDVLLASTFLTMFSNIFML